MLDMGFLPEIRKLLRFLPTKRQTLFFSATMPPPIATLTREMLTNPATIRVERSAAPPTAITQAVYPVSQELKAPLFLTLLNHGDMNQALVFTRTKHRANRLADFLVRNGVKADRIHGNRSQTQRTAALAGFKSGAFKVLVATDIAARGIDVEELGHVVNFDVPLVAEDYIHRVGRTGRADATGDAFTFVAPDEEGDLRNIEKAVGKRLPRVTVPDFDYNARPEQKLEVPRGERIAAIRAKKAEDRARAAAKAERRGNQGATVGSARPGRPARPARPGRPAVPGTNKPKPGGAPRRPGGNTGRNTGGSTGGHRGSGR